MEVIPLDDRMQILVERKLGPHILGDDVPCRIAFKFNDESMFVLHHVYDNKQFAVADGVILNKLLSEVAIDGATRGVEEFQRHLLEMKEKANGKGQNSRVLLGDGSTGQGSREGIV